MHSDSLYRHQQALDPSALTIVTAGVHAVAAVDDCRKAGRDPEADAAVILPARHLGRVVEAVPALDDDLRRRCIDQITAIPKEPFRLAVEHIQLSLPPAMTRIAA